MELNCALLHQAAIVITGERTGPHLDDHGIVVRILNHQLCRAMPQPLPPPARALVA